MRILDADDAIAFFNSMSAISVVQGDYQRSKMYQAAAYAINQLADSENNVGQKAVFKLINWITQSGFGYDNISEEYERYNFQISDMNLNQVQGLLYIAQREVLNEQDN